MTSKYLDMSGAPGGPRCPDLFWGLVSEQMWVLPLPRCGWIRDPVALKPVGPPSVGHPDEGWAEEIPTSFRALQWSAEGTTLRGGFHFLWQQESLRGLNPGVLSPSLFEKYDRAVLGRRDPHQRIGNSLCPVQQECWSLLPCQLLVFITRKWGESNYLYTNRAWSPS